MSFATERILLVDSYDSFTFNLASLCRKAAPSSQIYIIKNDELALSELLPFLQYFSAIIVGPGPGSPDVAADIGVVRHLWTLDKHHLLPIFGVCLGLQSLATECGATIKRLSVVKHGQVSVVEHTGTEIFKGVGIVEAVRYHSLHAQLNGVEDLEVLAWASDDLGIGKTVMALKHTKHPFWAVQYHPESVLTRGGGIEVMTNFWRLARSWNAAHDRRIHSWDSTSAARFGTSWPNPHPPLASTPPSSPGTVLTSSLHLPGVNPAAICDLFGARDETSPFVMLESLAQPGRFTIIGCLHSSSPRFTYSIGDSFLLIHIGDSVSHIHLESHDVWSWLSSFMSERKACNGSFDLPFWGGLIGYLSYELGVESLDVPSTAAPAEKRHPDVNLVFVERSIVLDSKTDIIYLQSIIDDDEDWLTETAARIKLAVPDYTTRSYTNTPSSTKVRPNTATVILPDKELYISRINIAKEYLYAGDSYELCLTAPTRVILNDPIPHKPTRHSSSWERYKHLRELNPAPHSAYLRLHPTTLLASSPERFLSFSRPPGATYQLRPIKGTVRKGPDITRAVAEKALRGSVKEVAENLMIVDLIRHDLHSVVGEDVDVTQFCKVEEYKTVWQLVSVIQGRPADGADVLDSRYANGTLGWELLRQSLPPGSMTGAPKKRSVKILQSLEDNERGVYSGVFGYWCVGGGGDWSVTIRSCFKYDDRYSQMAVPSSLETAGSVSTTDPDVEEWVMGAGGAITALSDPRAEWDEMTVKLQSVLRVFGAAIPRGN